MQLVQRGQGAEFFSTHPQSDNRIAMIQEWMPEAMKKYHMSDCHEQWRELSDQFRDMAWVRW
jgi:hypothetical protein